MGAVCLFSQLHGTQYQIEIFDERGSCVLVVVKPVDPFLRESRLLKYKHLSNPAKFTVDKKDVRQEAWDAVSADQMRKFIVFVEQPDVQASIKQLQDDLQSLARSHQASLSALKDRYVEKEQALTDAIIQIRKNIISLQIQSVAGGEADVNALRQHIIEEGYRVLASISNGGTPSSHFELPMLQSEAGKGVNVSALSGNVAFLSQLRQAANEKLKAGQHTERERIEAQYHDEVKSLTTQIQSNSESAEQMGFVDDEKQIAKLCIFADAIEAPKLLEECLLYVAAHFPKIDKGRFLTVSPTYPYQSPPFPPQSSLTQIPRPQPINAPSHQSLSSMHVLDAVPSITPPNLTQSTPIPIEGQIPKQLAPTQKGPLTQQTPAPTSPPKLRSPQQSSSPQPVLATQSSPSITPPNLTQSTTNSVMRQPSVPVAIPSLSPQSSTANKIPLSSYRQQLNANRSSNVQTPSPLSLEPSNNNDNNNYMPTPLQQRIQQLRDIMHQRMCASSSRLQSLNRPTDSVIDIMGELSTIVSSQQTPSRSSIQIPPLSSESSSTSHRPISPGSHHVISRSLSQALPHGATNSATTNHNIRFIDSSKSINRSKNVSTTSSPHNSIANLLENIPSIGTNLRSHSPLIGSSTVTNYHPPSLPGSIYDMSPLDCTVDIETPRAVLEDFKVGNSDSTKQQHIARDYSEPSHPSTFNPAVPAHRPSSPYSIQSHFQNLLQNHIQNLAQRQQVATEQQGINQTSGHISTQTSSPPSPLPSQFVLGLLKSYQPKNAQLKQETLPLNADELLEKDRLYREMILAKIRAETKKTHELNSRYRGSIKCAHNGVDNHKEEVGEDDEQLRGSGQHEDPQGELERERKLLQQQQQENHKAIRRAWGESDHVEAGSDTFNKSQEHGSSNLSSSPRRVRFGPSLSSESDDERIYVKAQEKTDDLQHEDSSNSVPNNDLRVKEGVMLAKIRKRQKLEEMKTKRDRSDKLKRLVASMRETAKEEHRRLLEKKADTLPAQDVQPTTEELELLARQEVQMRTRAIERVRESKSKMDSLRQRDEEEHRRKEQEKWDKRDEKLSKFVQQQRALQSCDGAFASISTSVDSVASVPSAAPSSSLPPRHATPSSQPRAGSTPRSSAVDSISSGAETETNAASSFKPTHLRSTSTSKVRASYSLGRSKTSFINEERSANSDHITKNQPQQNIPSKLPQPNFIASRRASPLCSSESITGEYTIPSKQFTSRKTKSTSRGLFAAKLQNKPSVKVLSFPQSRAKLPQPQPQPTISQNNPSTKANTNTHTSTNNNTSRSHTTTSTNTSKLACTNPNASSTQPEATTIRTRHPSLATIVAKKEFKKTSASPTSASQHLAHLSTPQQEQHETEVFKQIEREINREEKKLQKWEDEDVLSSVEKELFGCNI